MSRVRRIWPVVVTAGNLIQSEPLWHHIRTASRGKLTQPGVQPLTILDVGDYEAVCGLVEAGHAHSMVCLQPKLSRHSVSRSWLSGCVTIPAHRGV